MAAHPFAVLPQRTRGMSYLESPICIPAPVAFLYAKQGPKQLPSSTKPLVWITDLTSNYTSIYPQSVVRQSPPLHLSESLFIHSLQYSAYMTINCKHQHWPTRNGISNTKSTIIKPFEPIKPLGPWPIFPKLNGKVRRPHGSLRFLRSKKNASTFQRTAWG